MIISSLHNPRVKAIRALQKRRAREETGLFFVEGLQLVLQALELGVPLELLVVAPELLTSQLAWRLLRQQQRAGVPCLELSGDVFASLSSKEGPHGLAAVAHQRWEPLERVRLDEQRCWVALDAVQYPGNLGTILRTADATGCAGVLLLGQATDPYDPAAVRASTGAIFSQRLVRTSFAEFASWKRRQGAIVVGTSGAAAVDYRDLRYDLPLVLLMGCERAGLSHEEQALCDAMVRVPMVGRCDSLNLAVATGILLYEIFYQARASAQLALAGHR